MSNETIENEEKFYVRIKGRVVGPYSIKQLNTLRTRGQFSQSNEISSDGQTWESASILDSLFGAAKKTKREIEADTHESPTSQSAQWHYSSNGDQLGPTSSTAIQQMLERGELGLGDLVWKEGMNDWTPISQVAEFSSTLNFSNDSRSRKKSTKKSSSNSDTSASTHVFDILLQVIKSQFTARSSDGFRNNLIEFGHYTAYVCILLNAVFCFILAIKLKSVELGLASLAVVIMGLGLQYAAVKFCYALRDLLRAAKFPMSSRSFFDAMSVTFATVGVTQFIHFSVQAIHQESLLPLVFGIAIFLVCFRTSVDALFPEAMGYTFNKETRLGHEALSITSYFLLVPVRSVAALFSGGVAISTLGVLFAFFLLFSEFEKLHRFDVSYAIVVWGISSAVGNIGMIAPALGYIYFVFAIVLVDVLRSILEVPQKLDVVNSVLSEESAGQER